VVGEEFLGTGQYTRKAPALSTYEALAGTEEALAGAGEALAGARRSPRRCPGGALAGRDCPGMGGITRVGARQCPAGRCQYLTRTGSP